MLKIWFFASLREDVGVGVLELSSEKAKTIPDLFVALESEFGVDGISALRADNVRIAVNQEFITGNCSLHGGDEVAFLPPVTGG